MTYQIYITKHAESDLVDAADYIESVLLNPQASADLLDDVEDQISRLASFPKKYPHAADPLLKAWGIRYFNVKNYIVFYTVSEDEGIVCIIRFLPHQRNWVEILKKDISPD